METWMKYYPILYTRLVYTTKSAPAASQSPPKSDQGICTGTLSIHTMVNIIAETNE